MWRSAIQNKTGKYGGVFGAANVDELGVDKMEVDKMGVNYSKQMTLSCKVDTTIYNSKCTQGLHKFMVTCIGNVPTQGH